MSLCLSVDHEPEGEYVLLAVSERGQRSHRAQTSRDSDLIVGELVPGLLAVGEDLPQHHSKAPHITLCGEPPVHDALWGHPANR